MSSPNAFQLPHEWPFKSGYNNLMSPKNLNLKFQVEYGNILYEFSVEDWGTANWILDQLHFYLPSPTAWLHMCTMAMDTTDGSIIKDKYNNNL